jgi:type IV pilus assembly protein PilV
MMNAQSRRFAAGFSLLEVLIAMLVLSIGLLGLAGLQANSVSFNHGAYMRSQATSLAYDISDRMRANRQAALDEDYDDDGTAALPTCPDAVAAGTVAEEDLAAWHISLVCALPNGNGTVDVDPATQRATIAVVWDETRGIEDDATADDTEQFVLVAGL